MRELQRRERHVPEYKFRRQSRELDAMTDEIRAWVASQYVVPFGIEHDPDLVPLSQWEREGLVQ